jgi:hypothetical protein
MDKHHLVLIGGALALLWFVKHKAKSPSTAAAAAANSANASTKYTTAQAAQSANWWNYAGSWASA